MPRRLAACLGVMAIIFAPLGHVFGSVTERVVTNLYSGIAISGYDPVAYFVDREAKTGRPEFEVLLGGVPWRFINQGNRAAFLDAPSVYMPRFGGYDPVAVARGVATAGNPELWAIADQRLYLFFSARARDEFNADPERAIAGANARWSDVRGLLVD